MIVEYECKICGLKLNTDVVDEYICPKCGEILKKIFEKKWCGTIENGGYQTITNNNKIGEK